MQCMQCAESWIGFGGSALCRRLREWQSNRFGGPPADYIEPPSQPELSFAQGIKSSSSKPPEPSGPPPRHLRADSSHTGYSEEQAEKSSGKKRKKKNRGQSRSEWQRARGTLVRSRLHPLEQSGSELSGGQISIEPRPH